MASIKPLTMMVEAVAGEHVQVSTLVKPGQTPHDFAFKVSDRQKLSQADLLVWVGSDLEPYLSTLAQGRQAMSMAQVLEEPLSESHHDHSAESDHGHQHADQHFWLNPEYGVAMILAIAERLAVIDPAHEKEYQRNAKQVVEQLASFAAVKEANPVGPPRQYAVVHGAYHYFLAYFAYPEPLVLTPVPEISPGARQLWRVSQQLQPGDCLLVESASPTKWVSTFSERNKLNLQAVDIMGHDLSVSTYYELLKGVKSVFDVCTSKVNAER
ncbi:metal ABC transporter solute-binding protein, Zn/Mn family [Pseudomaricurvus sp.]|uniref:metal ABC transporter solute-binding protein, Zn/Mn family n=1 Tax=Pseudomaricurvus sp. TaxID=2004510 RepID=UPI003F6A7BC3